MLDGVYSPTGGGGPAASASAAAGSGVGAAKAAGQVELRLEGGDLLPLQGRSLLQLLKLEGGRPLLLAVHRGLVLDVPAPGPGGVTGFGPVVARLQSGWVTGCSPVAAPGTARTVRLRRCGPGVRPVAARGETGCTPGG